MADGARSRWPAVLLAGIGVALVVGGAVAVADPSTSGRPWWHEDRPQRVTGTVLSVDESGRTLVLDGLVSYRPVRAGIGTLVIEADDLGGVVAGDTVDVVLTRHDGRWRADELVLLDPD